MWRNRLVDVRRKLGVPDLRLVVAFLLLFAGACGPGFLLGMPFAQAQEHVWENERTDGRQLVVTVNKSRTIRIVKPFASAIVGATDIAEALPMSEHSLYIQGKKVGTTNLSIFDADKKLVSVIDVDVRLDTESLREKIASSTGSRGIRVSSSNGQIVLSGQVQNALIADQAMTLAKSMAGKDSAGKDLPVANAMSIASAQQVMLRVRFLEATRSAGRDLGVNWFASNSAGNRGVNTGLGASQGGPISQAGPGPSGVPLFQTLGTLAGTATSAPFGVALARVLNSGSGNVDLLISALETKGLIRRLAEPDLVALSGDTASFIAGGQIPVPSVQPSAGVYPSDHNGIQAVRGSTHLRSHRAGQRRHQPAPHPFGERTRFCQCRRCFRVPDPGPDVARGTHHGRVARRAELFHCRSAPDRRSARRIASAVARFGAGARRAVPQLVISAERDRPGGDRDGAPCRTRRSRTKDCLAAGRACAQQ